MHSIGGRLRLRILGFCACIHYIRARLDVHRLYYAESKRHSKRAGTSSVRSFLLVFYLQSPVDKYNRNVFCRTTYTGVIFPVYALFLCNLFKMVLQKTIHSATDCHKDLVNPYIFPRRPKSPLKYIENGFTKSDRQYLSFLG